MMIHPKPYFLSLAKIETMNSVETVILTLLGVGILAVGIMILMQLQKGAAVAPRETEVIVRREQDPWFHYGRRGWWGRGPYYAHLPVRPILY